MTNRKSLFVSLLVLGLLIVGLFLRNGEIILLSMPFLTYLVLGFLRSPGGIHLRAWRNPDKPIGACREPVKMRATVENTGESRLVVCVQDPLLPSMKILDGHSSRTCLLGSGERLD